MHTSLEGKTVTYFTAHEAFITANIEYPLTQKYVFWKERQPWITNCLTFVVIPANVRLIIYLHIIKECLMLSAHP